MRPLAQGMKQENVDLFLIFLSRYFLYQGNSLFLINLYSIKIIFILDFCAYLFFQRKYFLFYFSFDKEFSS